VDADATQLVLTAVISGSVAAVVLGFLFRLFFDRHLTRVTEEVKQEIADRALVTQSNREWRESSVAELLGPVYMQLERSGRAFERWRTRDDYLEGKVVREANTEIRDLLLAKAHLLPASLLGYAGDLIEHYDRWLEEYADKREGPNAAEDTSPVYVGPLGYPFPDDAEKAFKSAFERLRAELYDQPS
jgi:hypothetical protein